MPKSKTAKGALISDLGEFGLIDLIQRLLPKPGGNVILGIGDDTAALRLQDGRLLLATCDVQVEGRHFRRDRISPYLLGRRTAAINLSDIAAMGGTPLYPLVSLGLPSELEVSWVEEFYRGLETELSTEGALVVGGNLTSAEKIFVDLTLLGEVAEEEMLTRSGGGPGDRILVTGALGTSCAGLLAFDEGLSSHADVAEATTAHLTPRARVKEGRSIAKTKLATSMIDISDGLAGDLHHLCLASGYSARIWADRLPIAPVTREVARRLRKDPLDLALHGGEDYELLFTAPASAVEEIREEVYKASGTQVALIGEMLEASGPGPAMWLALPEGRQESLQPRGWDHFKIAGEHPRLVSSSSL